jgi:hypothetical protein
MQCRLKNSLLTQVLGDVHGAPGGVLGVGVPVRGGVHERRAQGRPRGGRHRRRPLLRRGHRAHLLPRLHRLKDAASRARQEEDSFQVHTHRHAPFRFVACV